MSEIPRPDMTDAPEGVRRYVEDLEQMYGARTIRVSRNGKFPGGWGLERWLSLLTFVTVVVGGIWFGGGEWKGVKLMIESHGRDLSALVQTVTAVDQDLDELKRRVDGLDVPPRVGPQPASRPQFSRESRFATPEAQ
jgi:hypothetical protein